MDLMYYLNTRLNFRDIVLRNCMAFCPLRFFDVKDLKKITLADPRFNLFHFHAVLGNTLRAIAETRLIVSCDRPG